MTKQDWLEPHIPVESSEFWLKSTGLAIPQTLIEADNDEVQNSWTIILSVPVHSLICTLDGVLEWNDVYSTKS
ncbi:hypothetical protein EV2_006987 [Malus domestica]